jgi:hypothetical protein
MNLNSVDKQVERSRIKQAIRECDLSLIKIDEDRLQLFALRAKCSFVRRLLASGPHTPQARSYNRARSHSRGVRQRRASR